MPYQDVMNVILSRQCHRSVHITGRYGEHRAGGPYGCSGLNYGEAVSGVHP